MVIFLYNQYIFVWIQHGLVANMAFALDLSSSVIKSLWYTYFSMKTYIVGFVKNKENYHSIYSIHFTFFLHRNLGAR